MSIATTGYEQGPTGLVRLASWSVAALFAALLVGGFLQNKETKFIAALDGAGNTEKAELLAAAILEDLITEDRGRIETTVEIYQEANPNFYSFSVTDEDGNVLSSWKRKGVPGPQKVLMLFTRFYPLQQSVVPVVAEGENYGVLTVEWDQSTVAAQRDSHSYAMAATIAIVCLVFAFLGYMLGRRRG